MFMSSLILGFSAAWGGLIDFVGLREKTWNVVSDPAQRALFKRDSGIFYINGRLIDHKDYCFASTELISV